MNLKERLPPLSSIVAFEAAARHGSYTVAAHRLEVTPAAISRQIGRIEAFLGVRVFQPLGRGRSLTRDGRELYEAVTVGLECVAAAVERIRQKQNSSCLTIATPLAFASLWLIPRVASFRKLHPEIELRFVTADADLDPVKEGLNLAVRYGSGEWPHLDVTPLLRPQVFPVCTPQFLEACGGLSSIHELLDQTLLAREADDTFGINWNTWLARLDDIPKHRKPKQIYFNSYEIVIRAALAGQGIALGVDVLVSDLLAQSLLISPLAEKVPLREAYYLVSPAGQQLTPEMAHFSQWLRAEAARDQALLSGGRPRRTTRRGRAARRE